MTDATASHQAEAEPSEATGSESSAEEEPDEPAATKEDEVESGAQKETDEEAATTTEEEEADSGAAKEPDEKAASASFLEITTGTAADKVEPDAPEGKPATAAIAMEPGTLEPEGKAAAATAAIDTKSGTLEPGISKSRPPEGEKGSDASETTGEQPQTEEPATEAKEEIVLELTPDTMSLNDELKNKKWEDFKSALFAKTKIPVEQQAFQCLPKGSCAHSLLDKSNEFLPNTGSGLVGHVFSRDYPKVKGLRLHQFYGGEIGLRHSCEKSSVEDDKKCDGFQNVKVIVKPGDTRNVRSLRIEVARALKVPVEAPRFYLLDGGSDRLLDFDEPLNALLSEQKPQKSGVELKLDLNFKLVRVAIPTQIAPSWLTPEKRAELLKDGDPCPEVRFIVRNGGPETAVQIDFEENEKWPKAWEGRPKNYLFHRILGKWHSTQEEDWLLKKELVDALCKTPDGLNPKEEDWGFDSQAVAQKANQWPTSDRNRYVVKNYLERIPEWKTAEGAPAEAPWAIARGGFKTPDYTKGNTRPRLYRMAREYPDDPRHSPNSVKHCLTGENWRLKKEKEYGIHSCFNDGQKIALDTSDTPDKPKYIWKIDEMSDWLRQNDKCEKNTSEK